MNLKQVSSFLIIAVIAALTLSCNSDDSLEGFVIAGDQSTVDHYFEFQNNEMTLISDEPFDGGTKTTYADYLDLNNDGFDELILFYEHFINQSGNGYYFLRIEIPSTIQLMGQTVNAFDSFSIYPLLLSSSSNVGVNDPQWTSFNNKTHLFYYEIHSNTDDVKLNVFNNSSDDLYLPFKINSSAEQGLGWLHIEPTDNDWRPRLLDIGYKALD
ncbi:MAG: hypothetical protein HWE07_02795 [Cytophagia bacterium]|nr:hypothetical protein [Cytophagia bacterium]